jgi:hypothetical protein
MASGARLSAGGREAAFEGIIRCRPVANLPPARPRNRQSRQHLRSAFPWSEAPRYLIRYRDGIYGAACHAPPWACATSQSRPDASCRMLSLAACITNMSESEFSAHTGTPI